MPLYLIETPLPAEPERDARIAAVARAAESAAAEPIEIQIGLDAGRIFAIVEYAGRGEPLETALRAAGVPIHGVVEVRLVGPSLEEVKAARGEPGYLVEWDLPADLTMDRYLARKREKAPGYTRVPETTFLRTYVCVDLSKCLCLYRAPDEAAVLRARAAVEAPVDRLTRIEGAERHVRA